MSADSSSSAANAALAERVEAIERDVEALSRALTKARHSRLILLVLLAPFVLVFVFLFLNLGKQFTEEAKQKDMARFALNQFFEQRQTEGGADEDWDQMLSRYQDLLVKEAEDLGKSALPVVQAAFRTQVENDTPRFTSLFNEQRDLLVANLQARAEPLVQQRYEEALKQHEHILMEEFDHYDEAQKHRMLANLNSAMDQLLKKYYVDEIERQLDTLFETYDHFPVSDPEDDLTPRELLLGTAVETMQVKLSGELVTDEVVGARRVDTGGNGGETESTEAADTPVAEPPEETAAAETEKPAGETQQNPEGGAKEEKPAGEEAEEKPDRDAVEDKPEGGEEEKPESGEQPKKPADDSDTSLR